MNERFRQLAEQAEMAANCGDHVDVVLMMERFAELIVQECVEKIETYQIPVGNSAAGEMAAEWTYDSLKELRDDIKEHFGIEGKANE
jgi:hypothetical protein